MTTSEKIKDTIQDIVFNDINRLDKALKNPVRDYRSVEKNRLPLNCIP
jgi:hypothetical protein